MHIIISGCGLSGMISAIAFSHSIKNCTITILGGFPHENPTSDTRTTAIAYGSKLILEKSGIWKEISQYAQEMTDIHIKDHDGNLHLHYESEFIDGLPMGYIIENKYLINHLKKVAKSDHKLQIIDQKCAHFDQKNGKVKITLEDNSEISGDLFVVAEGRNSTVYEALKIKKISHKYPQSSIVFNINHPHVHHNSLAQERFRYSGPFASLPMQGGHQSSIIWTEKSHLANLYVKMEENSFLSEVQQRLNGCFGDISLANEIVCYPLSLHYLRECFKENAVIIGDAAHSIHPIAGQGLNLTIRDIEALSDSIKCHTEVGLCISSALKSFSDKRKIGNMSMIFITDKINSMFSNDIFPVKAMRNIGLRTISNLPRIKKIFMKHAMGI